MSIKHVSYGEWREALLKIVQEGDFSNWKLGEWLFIGQQAHGETYAQAVSDAGISPSKAMAAMYTYQRFPTPSLRYDPPVKWSHHREVAGLEEIYDRNHWLKETKENNWTVSELKRAMREAGVVKQRVKKESKPPVCDKCGLIMVCPNHSCGGK